MRGVQGVSRVTSLTTTLYFHGAQLHTTVCKHA